MYAKQNEYGEFDIYSDEGNLTPEVLTFQQVFLSNIPILESEEAECYD